MQNNQNSKLKIIRNNKNIFNEINDSHQNNEIENIILSASRLSKTSEVKVYFKSTPANEYTLGHEKFCGVKINDLVFYNPSLFDLYPKLIDFICFNHSSDFENCSLDNGINNVYISKNEHKFNEFKNIMNTNLYLKLDITFDEMIKVLDSLTGSIYKNKVLKILTFSYVKN